jgi:predicted DCC family thiol-disulfide oxidoreductase YuxK
MVLGFAFRASRSRMNSKTQTLGWVLFDNSCGFCSRWIPFWGGTLRSIGLDFAPLHSDWVFERLGLSEEELIEDLRLLLADGGEIKGADVYRYVMRRVWWAYPFYLLACAPLLGRVFDAAYASFKRNRFHISRACRLSPTESPDRRT